ncbi:MAG: anti-sigma F factor [Desulfotomaculales bacterium]
MANTNNFKLEFKSKPENVGFARVVVAAFATQIDFTLSDVEDIKGAISEAVTNAIIHGYGNNPDGIITIHGVIHDSILEVVVEDQGVGIDSIPQALQPGFSTMPDRLGLGFSFMQSFMDTIEVRSQPGRGTRVIMTKKVSRRADHAQQSLS